jgi:hypothetical protein
VAGPGGALVMPGRRLLDAGLAAALTLVAVLTLLPTGAGRSWAAPMAELQWYATGWDSGTAMVQLFGNLLLLGPLAALAVLRWPALSAPRWLAAASVAAGAAVEVLQWALPLGRVVSPVDALLNAAGAVLTGLVVARLGTPARAAAAGAGSSPARSGV